MTRYAVVGTGALGGYYGGLLAKSGCDVHFLMRSDAEHVRRHGLQVDSANGDFHLNNAQAYASTIEMPPCDYIIVALKSTQNASLASLLPPLMHAKSYAIVLQNGLHVEAATEAIVGQGRVMGGCCFLCSNKVGPGHIRHLDYGTILMGSYRGQDGQSPAVPESVLNEVVNDFSKAGIPIEAADNFQRARWMKLMWNIPFNGLSVILNATTDALMNHPASRELAEATMRDVQQAARACGEFVPDDHVEKLMEHTAQMVSYDSSMRLDFLAGRPMEIETIFNNPLRAAQKAGYAAPIIDVLYRQLQFLNWPSRQLAEMSRPILPLCLAFVSLVSLVQASEVASTRPNVIVIVADDLGYGELGSYNGELPTPHLDAMAKSGVRFTNGYVTAPFCAASRAALLTGRYQTRFGFEFNPIGAQNADPAIGLPIDERTIADAMREAGYATGLIGKWHLGGTAKFHPQRRGFDEFVGFLHEGHYYVPTPWSGHVTWLRRKTLPDGAHGRWTSQNGRVVWTTHMGHFEPEYDADNPILRNSQPIETASNLTDLFTDEAEAFIDRHREQPFMLYLAYNAVHSPMQAADHYLERFKHIEDAQRRIFAAMLAHLDDSVGKLMSKLQTIGLDERTLIFFLSDNGGPTRELTSSNRPLRGEKGALLEGGIRVPFLMRWPTQIPSGHVEKRMVSSLDIFATTASLAKIKSTSSIDGVDLLPYLKNRDSREIHQELYWRVGNQAACRRGDWKLYRPRDPKASWELYHLTNDIGETKNLASSEPAKLAELKHGWQTLDSQMVSPLWGGPSKN